jgi:hypothetical protein
LKPPYLPNEEGEENKFYTIGIAMVENRGVGQVKTPIQKVKNEGIPLVTSKNPVKPCKNLNPVNPANLVNRRTLVTPVQLLK